MEKINTNNEAQQRDGPEASAHERQTVAAHAAGRLAIYAASLTDYNHGVLHGDWIDADQDEDHLYDDVRAMLARSPIARRLGEPAEEWAIHDYEGFGPVHLGEYESLRTVAELGQGISEHGIAFAHWASHVGKLEEDRHGEFEDAYLGEWHSVREYADHIIDDLGYSEQIIAAVPEHLQPYVTIDSSGFGRDLILGGDVYASETGEGTVHLFDAHS